MCSTKFHRFCISANVMKFRFVNFLLNEYYIGFYPIMKNRKFYNLYSLYIIDLRELDISQALFLYNSPLMLLYTFANIC